MSLWWLRGVKAPGGWSLWAIYLAAPENCKFLFRETVSYLTCPLVAPIESSPLPSHLISPSVLLINAAFSCSRRYWFSRWEFKRFLPVISFMFICRLSLEIICIMSKPPLIESICVYFLSHIFYFVPCIIGSICIGLWAVKSVPALFTRASNIQLKCYKMIWSKLIINVLSKP